MRYMGSKSRIARKILPIMFKEARGKTWVEPFMGSCGTLDKVGFCERIGNDVNPYIVALYRAVVNGWNPPENVSRETYHQIKNNKEKYPPELVGFIGFGCSFGGKFFGGFAADKKGTNYALQSKKSLLKQGTMLKGSEFFCCDYRDLIIPPRSLIYCDPPYKNTTKYYEQFNHEIFWSWCIDMAKVGHTVFVSEYSAPENPKISCVCDIATLTLLSKNSPASRTERLYLVKG